MFQPAVTYGERETKHKLLLWLPTGIFIAKQSHATDNHPKFQQNIYHFKLLVSKFATDKVVTITAE